MSRASSRLSAGLAVALTLALTVSVLGVTPLPSADGQFWDVQDTSPWAQDSGGIATGGRANPFNGFGYLKLRVSTPAGRVLLRNQYLHGFGLSWDGGERFDSISPVLTEGVLVSRALYAPTSTTWLRYFDSFTNTTNGPLVVDVAWGGAAGAYEDGGLMTVATTSGGNQTIASTDGFVTVMQNAKKVADPRSGPSGHGPSAHVLGSARGVLRGVGNMYADPFVDRWPGYDPAHIAYLFRLTLAPGQSRALVTFVVKGLSEVYDPRGGFPVAIHDALLGAEPVYAGADAQIPVTGSEIARVTAVARELLVHPDLTGLTRRQQAQIANWALPPQPAPPAFTVVEQSITDLQAAMTRGDVTSEDIVRESLDRIARFDRHGPTFRAILALNPRAIADARASDAERAAGRVRSPLHGVPIVFKDNIDALGLPTTGGSLALVDHRPRLDAHIAAGMRQGGAVVLGKSNLDEFPFGDFGISSVGGTIGNAYDPSLSTAGSSGGSATAVSTSMAALGFGTDTCNSLSNPSAFAGLSTIRATRGFMSRAGVMPLNSYNDTVGPMARSVKDVALALDLVMGSDPEDSVTADARSHLDGSFARGLDTASLSGARIGVLRQRFVGITGEREVADAMNRVIDEMRAKGATLVDVSIPDYDAQYAKARGSAPGSLKAGWEAYLSRGAKPGERVLTIDELLASRKLAPAGARRLETTLLPAPSGPALDAAVRAFTTRREAFRQIFLDLMTTERLDAFVYPANQARPHTHEGGLERYGGEPGTCVESAATGLPQVTVPAGVIGGRYPFGISLLGPMWADRRLLELAAAYEGIARHRNVPGISVR